MRHNRLPLVAGIKMAVPVAASVVVLGLPSALCGHLSTPTICSPAVAAANWIGTRANPAALNRQALRVAPLSRAMRRQISVATELVIRRFGPMAAARMAAHNSGVLAGSSAALPRRARAAQVRGQRVGDAADRPRCRGA